MAYYNFEIRAAMLSASTESVGTTNWLVTPKSFRPSTNKAANSWARQCIAWQICKTTKHVRKDLGVSFRSIKCFHAIHFEIVGPLRDSHSFRYWRTALTYRFTRWTELIPLIDIIAQYYVGNDNHQPGNAVRVLPFLGVRQTSRLQMPSDDRILPTAPIATNLLQTPRSFYPGRTWYSNFLLGLRPTLNTPGAERRSTEPPLDNTMNRKRVNSI